MSTHTIARHGGLNWMAENEDAGPYYLGNRWAIYASFGSRSLAVERAGSVWQREAFETSRAAFEALRLLLDPEERNGKVLHSAVRAATKAARVEYKRWSNTLNMLGGADKVASFQRDVFERTERELRK